MNRAELQQINAIVDRLIGSNKQMIDDAEKKYRQSVAILHSQEDVMRSHITVVRDSVDAYSQVIYRHTFYGGLLWRIAVIKQWLKHRTEMRQKPKLKKLVINEEKV